MNYRHLVVYMGLLCSTPYAVAEVYSCGPGCYTSSPARGHGKADLGNKIGSYTSVAPRTTVATVTQPVAAKPQAQQVSLRTNPSVTAPKAVSAVATAPTTPRLDVGRASGRRSILEQELNNERNALSNAQKALAESRAVGGQSDAGHQNRIRQLESAVLDRQQNIQALQRELGRM